MIYLGFPLPELEIIYPICAKGCRKIRDAEFLEDIRYHRSGNVRIKNIVVKFLVMFNFRRPSLPTKIKHGRKLNTGEK